MNNDKTDIQEYNTKVEGWSSRKRFRLTFHDKINSVLVERGVRNVRNRMYRVMKVEETNEA